MFENQNYILKNPEDNNYTPCENQPFVGFQYPAFKNPHKKNKQDKEIQRMDDAKSNPNILIAGFLLPTVKNRFDVPNERFLPRLGFESPSQKSKVKKSNTFFLAKSCA